MKKTILSMFLLIIFSPLFIFAQEANVGIIKGIWFSDTQFFEGDTIRVYTAVQNNSGSDVEGTIEFFDNGESLGEREFSALDGRIIESWVDTLAVSGEHEFSVNINQLQKNDVDSGAEIITAQSTFSERIAVVKVDTDGDRISDDIDTDDDGDGYLDTEEQEQGTDPLDKDSNPETKDLNSENIIDVVRDLVANIFTDDNPDPQQEESTQEDIEYDSKKEILEGSEAPLFIQTLAKDNNLIQSVNSQILSLQNTTRGFIEKEQSRIEKSEYPKTEKISTKNNSESASLEVSKNNKQRFFISLYSWILNLFSWLFSIWWFVVILLFLGIYIVLRLLFRIFGKRN